MGLFSNHATGVLSHQTGTAAVAPVAKHPDRKDRGPRDEKDRRQRQPGPKDTVTLSHRGSHGS